MPKTAFAIALLLLLWQSRPAAAADQPEGCGLRPEVRADLLEAWRLARPILLKRTRHGLEQGNPNALYLLEEYTHPFIGAARDCGMHQQLDELASLYLLPFNHLRQTTRGNETFKGWLCSGPACPAWPAKGGRQPFEVILYSCQFLYGATTLINAITLVPPDQRTQNMNALLEQVPFIANTYQRWLESHGDPLYARGVREATSALLSNKFRTDDKQLQIAGGIVELLSAVQREKQHLGIDIQQTAVLSDYAELYWKVIESRASFQGDRLVYDEAWGSVERNKAASFTGTTPPSSNQVKGVTSLSLDLGHFARVPEVLESYKRSGNAEATRMLQGLARQFAEQVWNGDLSNPRFYNYFSGQGMRGWYNRTFDSRGRVKSKGWAPLALSNKAPLYFQLGRYDSQVTEVAQAYYKANLSKLRPATRSDPERLLYILMALPGFVTTPTAQGQ
jgi:hypothetical protein